MIHLNKGHFFEKKIRSVDRNILAQKETSVIKTFLFRKSDFKDSLNKEIINFTTSFILPRERFNRIIFSI